MAQKKKQEQPQRPPVRRVDCSECPVTVDDVVYYPHQGQWVDIIPVGSLREMLALGDFSQLVVDSAAAEGDPDAQRELNQKLRHVQANIADVLGNRIVDWNMTDAYGRELPKPNGTGAPVLSLTAEEMWWLLNVVRSGPPDEKKD